jgi:hypothetical protein
MYVLFYAYPFNRNSYRLTQSKIISYIKFSWCNALVNIVYEFQRYYRSIMQITKLINESASWH